jgi:protease YdgD
VARLRRGVILCCVFPFLLATARLAALADEIEFSIGRLNYAGFSERQHCTATLVAPRVAVTARHCLIDGDITEMHLLLGYDGDDWREHLRPVAARTAAAPGDIALLCLDKPSAAEPVPFAARLAERGETVLVIGYGRPNVYVANRTSCQILDVDGQGGFLLDCLLTPGASGAPVLRSSDAGYEIVGVISGTNGTGSVAYRFEGDDGLAACGSDLPNE